MCKRSQKKLFGDIVTIAVVLAFLAVAVEQFDLLGVPVPRPEKVKPENLVRMSESQGWPDGWKIGQSNWFRHASQGTRILPKSWFMNLRQPSISPFAGKLADPDYLARFGFASGEKDPALNPDALPVGFAIENNFNASYDDSPSIGPVVGLTCAACHTGRLSYRQSPGAPLQEIRIEGGSAMINLSAFENAVGLSIFWTLEIGPRFEEFARAVANDEQSKKDLKDQLNQFFTNGLSTETYIREHKLGGTPGGFARTDALDLIGNRVFQALGNENLIVTDAPTNFPPLWDTAWFDWVQYNASIRMPMVRNIGEALGVGAPVNLDDRPGKAKLFDTTVNVPNLHWMEDQLGGQNPFEGLQPPRWDDPKVKAIFGEIDSKRLENGAKLYRLHCEACHLAPREELKADFKKNPHQYDVWEVDPKTKQTFLRVTVCDLQEIGTDPNQALNFYRRVALFQGRMNPAALGLFVVTEFIRENKYAALKLTPEQIVAFDRFRSFDQGSPTDVQSGKYMKEVIDAKLAYKARPLAGIWATPPFLHNGAVLNLYELLSPVAERSKTFNLGTTLFDPVKVGYDPTPISGGFELDTSLPGNSNLGHEFRDLTIDELKTVPEIGRFDPLNLHKATIDALSVPRIKRDHPFKGVIGPAFTGDERYDLIEFLKSM